MFKQQHELRALAALVLALVGAESAQARVILISMDGLRPEGISRAQTPTLDKLMAEGSSTFLALCDLPPATMTNHATMLTGVNATAHGVYENTDIPGEIDRVTITDICATAGLRAGFYASKSKLSYLTHQNELVAYALRGTPAELMELVEAQLRADPLDFIFIHSREPDSTGHASGWLSDNYIKAVESVDDLIGHLIDVLAEEELLDETTIIVTADHGGIDFGHVFNQPEVRFIPWVTWGKGIAAGRLICGEVRQVDTAATVLMLLGLEIPAGFEGKPISEALAVNEAQACTSGAPAIGPPCMFFAVTPALLGLGLVAWKVAADRRRLRAGRA